AGMIRMLDLAKVTKLDMMMSQIAAQPVPNRQELDRLCVAILHAAIRNLFQAQMPPPADCLQCIQRGPAPLFEAIESKISPRARRNLRDLLNTEIFGLLFQFHRIIEWTEVEFFRTSSFARSSKLQLSEGYRSD